MISANDLSPAELAALLHFHAEAGVDWLLEEEPVDRFAEFEAMKAARRPATPIAQQQPERPAQPEMQAVVRPASPAPQQRAAAPPPASRPQPAIPDG